MFDPSKPSLAVALVIDAQGRLLLVWNAKWSAFTLPMAKVDAVPPKETSAQAAVRAASETLGVPTRPIAGKEAKFMRCLHKSKRDGGIKDYQHQIVPIEPHPDFATPSHHRSRSFGPRPINCSSANINRSPHPSLTTSKATSSLVGCKNYFNRRALSSPCECCFTSIAFQAHSKIHQNMKPRIFVSSVSRELKSARQLVANTLLALGYEPFWQDMLPTSGEDIRPMLRKSIDSCSAVLQIVGDAYGAEPPAPDETFGRVSYTQYEALYAKAHGKTVYYLIAQSEMPRDATPDAIDTARDSSDEAQLDAQHRQSLQQEYRDRVQSTEHIFYPIQSHAEAELSVRRLKQDLDKLRRRFQSWMGGVSVALLVLVGGVLVANQGLWRQEQKINRTQQAINQQSQELKKLVRRGLPYRASVRLLPSSSPDARGPLPSDQHVLDPPAPIRRLASPRPP